MAMFCLWMTTVRRPLFFFIKAKSGVSKYFKDSHSMAEKQKNRKMIRRAEKGGGFYSREFENYLMEQGTVYAKGLL